MDEPYRPTIDTQADLEEVWRHLMGPANLGEGFGRRSVWLLRVDGERRVVPAITEIAECDEAPAPGTADGLAQVLRMLDDDDPGGSFAFLLSRPGQGLQEADRVWGRFLVAAGRDAGVRLEIVHLATDAGVVALPPDELMERRSA